MSQGSNPEFSRAVAALPEIKESLLSDDFIYPAAAKLGMTSEKLVYLIQMSMEETEHALRILSKYNLKGKRILEIGSGPGILAAALRRTGFDFTTLEPGGKGIEHNKSLAYLVMERLRVRGPHLEILAESLDPAVHGFFDFIFSQNVLEHIAKLHACFDAMFSVLAPPGEIVCHCPNYFIPYEPHYRCWLIPFFPRWTRPFLSARPHLDDGVWESLNFITYRDVKKAAKRHGCSVNFDTGLMAAAFERIDSDPAFRQRHGAFSFVYFLIRKLGLLPLLKRWPGQFGSPMTFRVLKGENTF